MAELETSAAVQRLITAQVALEESRQRVADNLIAALTLAMRKFANSGHLGYRCHWDEEKLGFLVTVEKYMAFRPRAERNREAVHRFLVTEGFRPEDEFKDLMAHLADGIAAAFDMGKVLFVPDKNGNLVETTSIDVDYGYRQTAILEAIHASEAVHIARLAKHEEQEARESILRTAVKRGINE